MRVLDHLEEEEEEEQEDDRGAGREGGGKRGRERGEFQMHDSVRVWGPGSFVCTVAYV